MDEPFVDQADVPFVLSCVACDVDSPSCYDEALAGGWTEIQFTPELPAENYLGLCPVCTQKRNAPAPGGSGGSDLQHPTTEEESCPI